MKATKVILAIVIAIPLLFFAVGSVLPTSTHVERSIEIDAPQNHVFYLVSFHKQFNRWSPWAELDNNMRVGYSGPPAGLGATMTWQGNQSVGSGTSITVEFEPNQRLVNTLDFGEMGKGAATYELERISSGGTRITWSFDSKNNGVIERYFGLFLDDILGPVYEKGLQSLKTMAESMEPVATESLIYQINDTNYHGYLAYPVGQLDPVPGVLVVHGIWGQTEHERERARMLANEGYAALAVDLYGDGVSTREMDMAIALMDEVGENTARTVALFDAALTRLHTHHAVDTTRTAAVGYSVGGAIVMNMARRGRNLMGVASFYGGFGDVGNIAESAYSPTLVANGLQDKFYQPALRETFEVAMAEANMPVTILEYPDAYHGFTNPASDALGEATGVDFIRYSKSADEDSWEKLRIFLNEAFY